MKSGLRKASIWLKKYSCPFVAWKGKFLLINKDGFDNGCLSLLIYGEYMDKIEKEIDDKFGRRLRLRVNGVLVQDGKLLMIKHKMSGERYFWNVPGGGMDYGSDAVDNLKREFLEETGLEISVNELLCVHEFLKPPLHAVELYFGVSQVAGKLEKGTDPELAGDKQIIAELAFLSIKELAEIKKAEKHRLFWELNSFDQLRKWKGYFNFENNCIK